MRLLAIAVFSIVIVACHSCPKQYEFSLAGNVRGLDSGQVVLLSRNSQVVDAAFLKNGKFVLQGKVAEPDNFLLSVGGKEVELLLDGKEMIFSADYFYLSPDSLKGSPANELRKEFMQIVAECYEPKIIEATAQYDINQLTSDDPVIQDQIMSSIMRYDDFYFSLVLDFVKAHPGSIFSVYLAAKEMKSSYEKGVSLLDALTPEMRESSLGKALQKELEVLASTAIGQLFPAFVAISEQGDTVRMDSLAGQVTVVDFWASWCGPCRKEMQSLKQLYRDYQGEGLRIISVSLDESAADWQKACHEEQIPWMSLRNPDGFENTGLVKSLGIKAIPFIVAVDKSGRIVAKGLRRDLLREKIVTLL